MGETRHLRKPYRTPGNLKDDPNRLIIDREGSEFGLGDWVEDEHGDEAEVVRVFKNGKVRLEYHLDYSSPVTVSPDTVALSRRAT